eukprot:tig00000144_g9050.t1
MRDAPPLTDNDEEAPLLVHDWYSRRYDDMPGDEASTRPAHLVADPLREFENAGRTVTSILKPVMLTIILVVFCLASLERKSMAVSNYWGAYLVYSESSGDSTAQKLGGALLNAIIFIAVILGTTILFVILFKFRCVKLMWGWIMLSVATLLAFLGGYLFYLMLASYECPIDWVTFVVLVWNFTIVGMLSIFWKGPMIIQQGYLIVVSAILAWTFTMMPDWTTWMLLGALVIYDLAVVLLPKGPLKMLVEMAQQRNEQIPGLIYDARPSTMHYQGPQRNFWGGSLSAQQQQQQPPQGAGNAAPEPVRMVENGAGPHGPHAERVAPPSASGPASEGKRQAHAAEQAAHAHAHAESAQSTQVAARTPDVDADEEEDEEEQRGIKLGLGDFVFYSVLIARAATYDWVTLATCTSAVLTGLCLTLLLLGIFRKALPALPISITLGIFFYFLTRIIILPFVVQVGRAQIFI